MPFDWVCTQFQRAFRFCAVRQADVRITQRRIAKSALNIREYDVMDEHTDQGDKDLAGSIDWAGRYEVVKENAEELRREIVAIVKQKTAHANYEPTYLAPGSLKRSRDFSRSPNRVGFRGRSENRTHRYDKEGFRSRSRSFSRGRSPGSEGAASSGLRVYSVHSKGRDAAEPEYGFDPHRTEPPASHVLRAWERERKTGTMICLACGPRGPDYHYDWWKCNIRRKHFPTWQPDGRTGKNYAVNAQQALYPDKVAEKPKGVEGRSRHAHRDKPQESRSHNSGPTKSAATQPRQEADREPKRSKNE
jgi:hypothetical protein